MHEKVKQIIDEAKKWQEREKDEFLISHGLYDEEYVPLKFDCTGYATDDSNKKVVSFTIRKTGFKVGDTIKVRINNEVKDVTITELTPKEEDFDGSIYDKTEFDHNYRIYRHYKPVKIEVTDDEYKKLVKIINTEGKEHITEKNIPVSKVPDILYVIGALIWISGFISGFVIFSENESGLALFITWVTAFISGILFVAFGKTIDVLEQIKVQLIKIYYNKN